jgi:ComF family protein
VVSANFAELDRRMHLAVRHVTTPLIRAVDLIMPPRCPRCGGLVDRQGDLCGACWSALRFLDAPVCDRCGVPLPDPEAFTCAACLADPPVWDRARAALRYDPASARLILAFKNGGRFQAVDGFARWMARAGAPLLGECDLIVPVPLHRWRLWRRGHNQSAILARSLGRLTGRPVELGLLRRVRATESQRGKGAAARARNVTMRCFAVSGAWRERLDGKRILLVDDVLTTGATLGACAGILKGAGADMVNALVLARVAREENVHISAA